jgi:type VI secretion system protein ImpE
MVVRNGPDGEVYLPALYAGSHLSPDDRVKLGRLTDWQGGGDAPMCGIGQKTFLVGDSDLSSMELVKLEVRGTGG